MINQVLATKISMGQTWTKSGKRLPITRLQANGNVVVGEKKQNRDGYVALQIGFGKKKLNNMTKPLREQLTKSGFSFGVRKIKEVKIAEYDENSPKVGEAVKIDSVLKIGDLVDVQGITKGRGFAGVVKRHGFSGGPRTHGQSDRERAPGSIGQGTTPGRVFKGKRMAGHYGTDTLTVKNLQIVHLDPATGEVWLSGPVPGHFKSIVRLTVRGNAKFEGLNDKVKPVMTEVIAEEEPIEATPEVEVVEEANVEEKAEVKKENVEGVVEEAKNE